MVHTSQPILSAENLVDFQRFMGELDRAGRENHFWKMWGAVWEVCHLPIPDEGRQVPLRGFVCVAPECRRCNQGVGGFQFPLESGASGGLFSQLSLIASTTEQVRGSTKCSPPVAAGNKANPFNFGRTPLLMCPRLKQSSWTRSLGCCMLLRRHLRYRCHMPATSVGRSWGSETLQVHAGTAGCVLPGSSAWLARAPVTPEGQAITNPRVERGTLCPGGRAGFSLYTLL